MQTKFYWLLMLYPLIYLFDNLLKKTTELAGKQRMSILACGFLASFYFLFHDFVFSSLDRSYFMICSVTFSLFFLNEQGSTRVLFKAFTLMWFALFNIWQFTGITDIVLLLGIFCFFDTDKKSEHSLFYNLSWIIIAVVYFFVKEFQGQELGNLFYEVMLVVSVVLLMPKEKNSPYLSILQYVLCLSVLQRFISIDIELSPYFYILFLLLQLIFSAIKIDKRYQAIQLMSICMTSAVIFLPVFGLDSFYQLFLVIYLLVFGTDAKLSPLITKIMSVVHVFYLFLIGHVVYLNMSFLTNLQLLSGIFLIITLAYRQKLFSNMKKAPRQLSV